MKTWQVLQYLFSVVLSKYGGERSSVVVICLFLSRLWVHTITRLKALSTRNRKNFEKVWWTCQKMHLTSTSTKNIIRRNAIEKLKFQQLLSAWNYPYVQGSNFETVVLSVPRAILTSRETTWCWRWRLPSRGNYPYVQGSNSTVMRFFLLALELSLRTGKQSLLTRSFLVLLCSFDLVKDMSCLSQLVSALTRRGIYFYFA